MKRIAFTVGLCAIAGAALAHSGVQNPAVKARMDLMGDIKEATGVLGGMAKGAIPFDAAKAEAARVALYEAAVKVPASFEAPEMDPKSEAVPAIWEKWDDFTAKSDLLVEAAAGVATDSIDDLRAGLMQIGQSCGACHKSYRIDK